MFVQTNLTVGFLFQLFHNFSHKGLIIAVITVWGLLIVEIVLTMIESYLIGNPATHVIIVNK